MTLHSVQRTVTLAKPVEVTSAEAEPFWAFKIFLFASCYNLGKLFKKNVWGLPCSSKIFNGTYQGIVCNETWVWTSSSKGACKGDQHIRKLIYIIFR